MATSIRDVASDARMHLDTTPFVRIVPPLADVRSMLERFSSYEIDGEPHVFQGGVGDRLLVFAPEGRRGLLTRRRTDRSSDLPDLAWIRILVILGRFRRLDPPTAAAGPPPSRPPGGRADVVRRQDTIGSHVLERIYA